MPTPTKGPRLGGSPAHERLMLANLATSLFKHGKITTTETKAKRLRPLAEQGQAEKRRALSEAEANPVVRAVLDGFSGAKIIDIRDLAEVAAAESAAVADDGETPDFMVQQQDDGVYYPLDDEGEY